MPHSVRLLMLGALLPVTAAHAQAERRLSGTIAPTVQTWQFGSPVPLDTLRVSSARQIAAPFALNLLLNLNWRASITGAAFASQIATDGDAGTNTLSLTGLTDVRARLTGRLLGDALQATVGVNLPLGPVGLSGAENDVLRTVGAPALGAAVAVPGVGFGGTVGVISAHVINEWAVAGGLTYEQRGRYAPLEVTLVGASSKTELIPGGAVHVSLGADGLVGRHRLTVGVVGDLYGTDQLQLTQGSRRDSATYQLGPSVLVSAVLAIENPRIRDFAVHASNRYRTAFADGAGRAVAGSSGNYWQAGISGVLGAPNRVALALGADVRLQSGLPVDNGFIGAGLTGVGFTAGLSIPRASVEWRPTISAVVGTLSTNRISTSMRQLATGMVVQWR